MMNKNFRQLWSILLVHQLFVLGTVYSSGGPNYGQRDGFQSVVNEMRLQDNVPFSNMLLPTVPLPTVPLSNKGGLSGMLSSVGNQLSNKLSSVGKLAKAAGSRAVQLAKVGGACAALGYCAYNKISLEVYKKRFRDMLVKQRDQQTKLVNLNAKDARLARAIKEVRRINPRLHVDSKPSSNANDAIRVPTTSFFKYIRSNLFGG